MKSKTEEYLSNKSLIHFPIDTTQNWYAIYAKRKINIVTSLVRVKKNKKIMINIYT